MPAPLNVLLPALAILAAALFLSVRATRAGRSRRQDPAGPSPQLLRDAEKNGAARVERLELRLNSYSREIEERIESSAALLDELIRQQDDEIARLSSMVDESRREFPEAAPAVRMLTAEQRRMICFLAMAGFRSAEIARLAACPVGQIEGLLADRSRGANAA